MHNDSQSSLPATYRDHVLGDFARDDSIKDYRSQVAWNGAPITLWLQATNLDELFAAANLARDVCRDAADWDRRAREFAASEYVAIHNQGWRESENGDETPLIDASQFVARITPESVWVRADKSMDIWYSDGDLFWGHSIQVCVDQSGAFSEANLAG
jgi:hypothetical protein